MKPRKNPPPRFKKFMRAARTGGSNSVISLHTIKTPEQLPGVVLAAIGGNHEAQLLTRIIEMWVKQLVKTLPGEAPLCGTCDHEFSWPSACPAALVVAMPYANNHNDAVVTGLCTTCVVRAGDDLSPLALKVWHKILPGAEVLPEGTA
jgi:ABC-type molybdate transport system permease subunit